MLEKVFEKLDIDIYALRQIEHIIKQRHPQFNETTVVRVVDQSRYTLETPIETRKKQKEFFKPGFLAKVSRFLWYLTQKDIFYKHGYDVIEVSEIFRHKRIIDLKTYKIQYFALHIYFAFGYDPLEDVLYIREPYAY